MRRIISNANLTPSDSPHLHHQLFNPLHSPPLALPPPSSAALLSIRVVSPPVPSLPFPIIVSPPLASPHLLAPPTLLCSQSQHPVPRHVPSPPLHPQRWRGGCHPLGMGAYRLRRGMGRYPKPRVVVRQLDLPRAALLGGGEGRGGEVAGVVGWGGRVLERRRWERKARRGEASRASGAGRQERRGRQRWGKGWQRGMERGGRGERATRRRVGPGIE